MENLDRLELSAEESAHIDNCDSCREAYEEYNLLAAALAEPEIEMTDLEFARMQQKLDKQIANYTDKAFGFYNWFIRYGVSVAATMLIVIVSLFSSFNLTDNSGSESYTVAIDDSYNIEFEEVEDIDQVYIDLIIGDFSNANSSYASESFLGEIDEDEYEYLLQNINIEDIL